MDKENSTILELRKKLEVRTWFLRASLGINVAFTSGLVYYILQLIS